MSGVYDEDGIDLALPPVSGLKMIIEIDLGNDLMQDASDVWRAIREALHRHNMFDGGDAGAIKDINGNRVGSWSVVEDRRTT